MTADISIEENRVVIEGLWTLVRTWDLMLDAPDRRSSDLTSQYRRALVHDADDGLTINYDSDYPGGVKIRGKVSVDDLQVTVSRAALVAGLPRWSSVVADDFDERLRRLPGGFHSPRGADQVTVSVESLLVRLMMLEREVESLTARIVALEGH